MKGKLTNWIFSRAFYVHARQTLSTQSEGTKSIRAINQELFGSDQFSFFTISG